MSSRMRMDMKKTTSDARVQEFDLAQIMEYTGDNLGSGSGHRSGEQPKEALRTLVRKNLDFIG